MEVKNLMIGDWVLFGNEPHKVLSIDSENAVFLDLEYDLIHVGLIEPIPITTKFLEKNGFCEDVGFHFSEYFNLHEITDNTYSISNTAMQVSYVHELQHALRLCGIEKDIEL